MQVLMCMDVLRQVNSGVVPISGTTPQLSVTFRRLPFWGLFLVPEIGTKKWVLPQTFLRIFQKSGLDEHSNTCFRFPAEATAAKARAAKALAILRHAAPEQQEALPLKAGSRHSRTSASKLQVFLCSLVARRVAIHLISLLDDFDRSYSFLSCCEDCLRTTTGKNMRQHVY